MPDNHNTTVSNALKIYFWGNYFLNIVEYTGNLQGKCISNTFFFFFFRERIGIFIMFCFSKCPVNKGSPTDLPSCRARLRQGPPPRPLSRPTD
jgi:hypothetical protein